MIYLDNSATTAYKPDCVKRAALTAIDRLNANAGRSGHKKSVSAAMLVYRTRNRLQEFVGCNGHVAFTLNCTEGLNLAILGSVRKGGHVIADTYSHNSVLRPLTELEQRGLITLSIARPDENGKITYEQIRPLIRKNTYLIAVNHVSNVTGAVADIDGIGNALRSLGIMLLVDGAQSVGYLPVDMARQNISMLSIAPHKGLHALQGVGALCMAKGVLPSPIKYGGTGTQSLSLVHPTEPPECYEAGTLPLVSITALSRALDWTKEHFEEGSHILSSLGKKLRAGIGGVSGVRLLSPENQTGIVTFNVGSLSSEQVCDMLDKKYDIGARSGLHCAPLVHRYLGTVESGAVRFSLGCDNTEKEVELAVRAVEEIAAKA